MKNITMETVHRVRYELVKNTPVPNLSDRKAMENMWRYIAGINAMARALEREVEEE